MTKYIDVPNLILFLKCGEYESSENIIKFIENNATTDVIERSEFDDLHEKYLKAIHNHTECLKELHALRSKIDKSIEEMDCIDLNEYADNTYQLVNECTNILKGNIGE